MAGTVQRMPPRLQRATIRDLATAAGVSIATASKALNQQGRMTPETRERVQRIAREIGFRPSVMARALVGKRSFTLGLITNDTYGRFTLPVAAGLSAAMADRGVSVFLCTGEDDPERVHLNIEAMQDKHVDGIVIAGKRVDRVPPTGQLPPYIPVVYVNAACPPDAVGFMPDDEGGAVMAIRHLLTLGRRRIAHVTGPRDFAAVAMRAKGWQETLAEAGCTSFGEALYGDWSEAFGYDSAARLFGHTEKPDAVFCGNDQIARGLIDALRERGIAVPGDVSIVGYDNWEIFAQASRPPLTTIDMELTDLGRLAGLTLLDMIEDLPVQTGIRRMPCRLVVRGSCGGSLRGS